MLHALRNLPSKLRFALVMLLVLGTVAHSGLQLFAAVHAAEHAAHAALMGPGHLHDGSDVPSSGEPATSHGVGSHGLLHLHDCVTFATVSFIAIDAKPTLRALTPASWATGSVVPTHSATPFRPPIA